MSNASTEPNPAAQQYSVFYVYLRVKFLTISLSSVILFTGHSMGGKTVMSASLLAPEMVEKLIVVDIAPTVSNSNRESLDYMIGMKNIDLSMMKTKRDVENEVKKFVKVRNFFHLK